jgi:hypothetical protein
MGRQFDEKNAATFITNAGVAAESTAAPAMKILRTHNRGTTMQPISRRKFLNFAGLALLGTSVSACGGGSGGGDANDQPGSGDVHDQPGGGVPSAPSPAPGPVPGNVSNPQPVPTGALTDVHVSVLPTRSGAIGPDFIGLSYEKSIVHGTLFSAANTDMLGLLRAIGPGLLRIGGNSVDRTDWNPNGSGQTSGEVAPADIRRLAGFLNSSGWRVLYGVNLGQSTPAAAAAEVAYAASVLGGSLSGIEIGNEPDLYVNRGYFTAANWTPADFISRWESFAVAVRNAAPGVSITGPSIGVPKRLPTWTAPFVTREHSGLSLVTQHYYRSNGPNPGSTVEELVLPDPFLATVMSDLKAASAGLPYRMAETNSYFGGGIAGVSNTGAAALWVIDHLFAIARGGATGVNMHGGGNSDGYTPIATLGSQVQEVRPEFYGLYFMRQLQQSALYDTGVTMATAMNVSAYAMRMRDGTLSIAVVNKDSVTALNMTIDCGFRVNGASLAELRAPSLSATSGITYQGKAIGLNGSIAPAAPYTLSFAADNVMAYVPPTSAVLIRVA